MARARTRSRKAFRKLAKANHPDTNPDNKEAEERFKRVSGAFDILGDAAKRKKFDAGEIDADGRETARGFAGGGPWGENPEGGFGGGGARYQSQSFEGVDLGDILGEMFGGGRGAGRGGGAGGGFGGFSQRGSDVRARLDIDLEDAIRGAKRRISFSDGPHHRRDHSQGRPGGPDPAPEGPGRPPAARGPGDALIELAILPHPIFRREGDVLVMDVPVTAYDAVLGGKTEAPTPDGPVTLTIPKGANTGTRLRLKGRGLTGAEGRRGDLFARLVVTLPDEPDSNLDRLCGDLETRAALQRPSAGRDSPACRPHKLGVQARFSPGPSELDP